MIELFILVFGLLQFLMVFYALHLLSSIRVYTKKTNANLERLIEIWTRQ